MTEMQALVKTADGEGNIERKQVPVPGVGPEEVLIEVAFCGICGSDLHIETGAHPVDPPVVLGHEFSGTVAGVGEEVTAFSPGDAVGFHGSWHPFPGVDGDGAFAEYIRAPAASIWNIPQGIDLKEATQFETVRTPMTMVRDTVQLEAGERAVVSGPGPIGLLGTNIAKMEGASAVVVLGTESDSAVRLPAARRLGADDVFVFGDDALASLAEDPPSVWFETSGAAPAIEAAVDHVAPGGRVACTGLGDGPWNIDMRRVAYENIRVLGQWGGKDGYIEPAAEAIQSGQLNVAEIITDTVPLSEWQDGFEKARSQSGIKVLLDPSR